MSHSRDESRSPSPDQSASPRSTCHRPRSRSPSPDQSASPKSTHHRPRSRSRSKSLPKRSRSRSVDASNPGNNLYVTGLSTRVTTSDLEKFFGKEGKVLECNLVTDPRTKESRGFAFVSMETVEGAERCLKYLNRSVLEGRLVTVEKAKRSRGRTPTPGRYQGLRERQQGRSSHPSTGTRPHPVPGRGHRYSPPRCYDRGHYDRSHIDRHRDPYARERPRSPYGRRPDHHYEVYNPHRRW